MTDYVFTYDDYEGYLEITARGNKGSIFRAFFKFTGFYVRPILTLSRAKQGQIGYSPQYQDVYEIAPKSTAVNVTISTASHCVNEISDYFQTFKAGLSKIVLTPAPPFTEHIGPEIGRWMYTETKNLKRDDFEVAIRVHSRQPDGGKAYLSLFSRVMPHGEHYRAWITANPVVDRTGDIAFSTTGSDNSHEHVSLSKLDWHMPNFLVVEKPFSLEDISLSYNGSSHVATPCHSPYESTLSDTVYDLDYKFLIAAKKEIDAVLEPADVKEAAWEPKPGDIREYKLTLNDPGPEEVQAVRFTLLETSDHPGITTNAGNHVLPGNCLDCKTGKKDEKWPWETFFTNQNGQEYAVRREYTHYNSCPIDSLPDMFFRDIDNQGWEMGDQAISENLRYTVSQQISHDVQESQEKTYAVKVCIKDGAASAKLKAEVQIGGIWYEARAQGDTAAENGVELLLPLDKDADGLQDKWESRWGVSDPDRDADSHLGARYTGDGLTVFEEYRGIIYQGRHHRMSPVYKDIFVYDYSGYFASPLSDVFRTFSAQELSLWNLKMNEFKYDVINYPSSDHKKGDQYIIVIMGLMQNRGLGIDWAGGRAAHVGPPTRESNTIVIKDSRFSHESGIWSWTESAGDRTSTAGILAHEIGHLINLPHHGESEGYRKIPGHDDDQWIACLEGQHSGDRDCIMAYVRADYFIDLNWVPRTDLGRWLSGGQLVPYTDPDGKRLYFCTKSEGSGMCGDASQGRGNCLSQVKVKSY